MKNAVIVANGSFPSHPIPLDTILQADFLICCDGAIQHLDVRNIVPDIIIGDFDSANKTLLQKYSDKLVAIADQKTNDLTKAVNWSLKNNFTSITIVGAAGKREDHFIGNFSLLDTFGKHQKTRLYTDYGFFEVLSENAEIKCYKGQQISLFALNSSTVVSTYGLKYPLKNETIPTLWFATLNEALSTSFKLTITEGHRVIVYKTFATDSPFS